MVVVGNMCAVTVHESNEQILKFLFVGKYIWLVLSLLLLTKPQVS